MRSSLIRFRFGINVLAVNKVNKSNEESKCPFCNSHDDEGHFLLECRKYDHLRHRYLHLDSNAAYNKTRQCKYLMNGNSYLRDRAVAMFIYYALKLRE